MNQIFLISYRDDNGKSSPLVALDVCDSHELPTDILDRYAKEYCFKRDRLSWCVVFVISEEEFYEKV